MREHQIVINLKPEQFEEVQRMARAAGLKSVNSFVRQKLIATLGLAAPGAGAAEENDGPDIKQLTGELRRLHRELQIFVADSLSNSDYVTAAIEPIPFPTAVQENFLAEGAPLMPESVGFTYRDDSIAASAFGAATDLSAFSTESSPGQSSFGQPQSVSGQNYARPQLPGQFPPVGRPQYSNFQAPIVQAATPQTTDLQAPSAVSAAGSAPSQNPGLQPAYAMPPDPNMNEAVSSQPAFSVPEAPPETSSPAMPSQAQPSMPQSPSQAPASAPNVQQFAENDELEDLAERAFAISPRLGQLDEAQRRFPDPLRDLLEDALFNENDEADGESGTVADSSTSVSEDADVADTESGADFSADGETDEPTETDYSTPEVRHSEATESEEWVSDESIEEEPVDAGESSESQTPPEDEPPADPAPPDPPQQFPPPVSGGPPPRKRRT